MLADISYNTGPPSIRNENGQLVGFVFVDITTDDIDGYVQGRQRADLANASNSRRATTSSGPASSSI